jgi:ubiquitin-protein ligase
MATGFIIILTMESRRLQKEYEELTKLSGSNSGVRANNIGSDMTHWKGIIDGPVSRYIE